MLSPAAWIGPNEKAMGLFLLASTLRDLGAKRILLAAPYLGYMRQDRTFLDGEGVSARYFSRFLSSFLDGLVTVDPHLHRIRRLEDDLYDPGQGSSCRAGNFGVACRERRRACLDRSRRGKRTMGIAGRRRRSMPVHRAGEKAAWRPQRGGIGSRHRRLAWPHTCVDRRHHFNSADDDRGH